MVDMFCPRDCEHLNFSESEQEYVHALTKTMPAHWCEKYDTRLWHILAHPDLYKCEQCLNDNIVEKSSEVN